MTFNTGVRVFVSRKRTLLGGIQQTNKQTKPIPILSMKQQRRSVSQSNGKIGASSSFLFSTTCATKTTTRMTLLGWLLVVLFGETVTIGDAAVAAAASVERTVATTNHNTTRTTTTTTPTRFRDQAQVLNMSLPTRLRIIHITDVYQLDNFPSLSTLISEKRNEHADMHTISLLSGDFLMPYLLSAVDGGRGMMSVLNALPMDYVTWGNHENDLPHDQLMQREAEYTGQWINTNMKSHESFKTATSSQIDHKVFTLRVKDDSAGNNNATTIKKIALLGILTNDPSVVPPGAFGGATVDDPWDTMREYRNRLYQHDGVDLVVPICHLYEAQDERTMAEFDFPLILGGHDHHVVNQTIDGTLLLKPGADAHYAHIIDLFWDHTTPTLPSHDSEPRLVIQHELVRVADYAPNPDLQRLVNHAHSVLEPLQQTQLDWIPNDGCVERPLTSVGARSQRISVAVYLGGVVRRALQWKLGGTQHCHAFVAKGGNFHGGKTYDDVDGGGALNQQQLTLELLLAELDNVIVSVTELPGRLLQVGLRETWDAPGTGWFQYDNAVVVDPNTGLVTHVAGEELDPHRLYKIATMNDFFRSRDGPTIGQYYEDDVTRLPSLQMQFGLHDVVLDYFAHKWWTVIWEHVDQNNNDVWESNEFQRQDLWDGTHGNGEFNVAHVLWALENVVGLQTHPQELTLAKAIFDLAAGRRRSDAEEAAVAAAPETSEEGHVEANIKNPQEKNETVTQQRRRSSNSISLDELNRVHQERVQMKKIEETKPYLSDAAAC